MQFVSLLEYGTIALLAGILLLIVMSSRVRRAAKSKEPLWRPVLDSELARWEALTYGQLLEQLVDLQAYSVDYQGKTFQVEVELIENTPEYLHVIVAVDDGELPESIKPLAESFIRKKF